MFSLKTCLPQCSSNTFLLHLRCVGIQFSDLVSSQNGCHPQIDTRFITAPVTYRTMWTRRSLSGFSFYGNFHLPSLYGSFNSSALMLSSDLRPSHPTSSLLRTVGKPHILFDKEAKTSAVNRFFPPRRDGRGKWTWMWRN